MPVADVPAPIRQIQETAVTNQLFVSTIDDESASAGTPGPAREGHATDAAAGEPSRDGIPDVDADRMVVTIAPRSDSPDSPDSDPLPIADGSGATPPEPDAAVVGSGIDADWGTPIAAAPAGRDGDGLPASSGDNSAAAERLRGEDVGDLRRWDDHDTDVMHAVGRRPEALADRQDIEVTVQHDDRSSGGRWYEIPLMLLLAFSLAFLLRTFVVQIFYVPSGSMIPTLEINDRIAAEKVTSYFRDVTRGDVIVFAGDEAFGADLSMSTGQRVLTGVGQFLGVVPVDAEDFVKRIIGLPGDTVEIVDGIISVNGVELDEPYAILDSSNGVWEVPEGSLFVMGDNRPNSGDSRTSLGYIDEDDVVGRAVAKIWPLDRIGSVEGVDWDAIPDPS